MGVQTEEDFIALVKKAEQEAESNPRGYVLKLALFACLGYVVIFLVLFSLIALVGGLVASVFISTALFLLLLKKKLIFAIGLAIWVLLRALWVKFAPPEGYSLKRDSFPELFNELDTLSRQLSALKIHEVVLDHSLNAAVIQHPRFGIIGWHKNYLVLGYQLLLTLSPEEMRAVLAHEFGHLSGNHSRFSAWIYRVRHSWMRIMQAFSDSDSWGGKLMRKFFNWYAPQFDAYSFALARSNEYEADAVAAELTSPETATRALVNVHATAPYLDQSYWDTYFKFADEYEEPPYTPFNGLARFLRDKPLAREELLERIKKEMALETHYADTHPSLKDRVEALNAVPQLPQSAKISAAEAWLGKQNQALLENFDQRWLLANREAWKQRYEYVTTAKQRLKELSVQPVEALADDDLWQYAYWTQEFGNGETALPLFKAFQQRHPNDSNAAFFIGTALLARGEADALAHLRLARKNPNLIERASQLGYEFLKRQGDQSAADAWWQESLKDNAIFIAARNERASVTARDKLSYPQIDDKLLEQLKNQLQAQPKVDKVWLAQKAVTHFPENPVYIIAFTPKGFSFSADKLQAAVAETMNLPADFFVVCKAGDNKTLAKKVMKAGKPIL